MLHPDGYARTVVSTLLTLASVLLLLLGVYG